MDTAIENSVYHLVIDVCEDRKIFVFLESEPFPHSEGGPISHSANVHLLPPSQRFGGNGGVAMGLPILGQWRDGNRRFRQFLTVTELMNAGWIHVPNFRFVDSWEEYCSPWSPTPVALPIEEDTTTCSVLTLD
jgi:hypothetical protein